MTSALGQPPAGAPGWLNAVWIGLAVLVAVFGRGFGSSIAAGIRSMRAGIAMKESHARQQERELRAETRAADEAHDAALYTRMREQMDDMGGTITALRGEVSDLRSEVRAAYAREQQMLANLTHHAGWDFIARPYLPEGFPEPPPLLPPRDQVHTAEWGPSPG